MIASYASLCDGIGAVHVAWRPLGWRCLWTSEIDRFACAVVDHHWRLPNLGDMTRITEEMIDHAGKPDLIVGGTPCQSFSSAGNRLGVDDPRGLLALEYVRVLGLARARWFVWENVPGVLNANGGRAFAQILRSVADLGYGFAWRVLDAQFFGVPQRRRRVFVVGYLGDWRPAATALFEPERPGRSVATHEGAPTHDRGYVRTLKAQSGRHHYCETYVLDRRGLRELSPRERERLQGFPDDYTLIDYRGRPARPTPRNKAVGNSMAVPVMAWIGRRITMADGGSRS